MQAHGAYLRGLAEKGQAIAFGPALDPKGASGGGDKMRATKTRSILYRRLLVPPI
jgi:hypothetical protein